MRKYIYDKALGIAGIEDETSGIKVYTLLQHPGVKKAAFNAYAGARYSRSPESIFTILREVLNTSVGKGIAMDEFASERIEKIVHSYNHPSVAGMSHNFIAIENIPMMTAMRFFYLNAIQDGQERSTRFQNFSKPNFWIPTVEKDQAGYEEILHYSIDCYNQLQDETYGTLKQFFNIDESNKDETGALGARTFDTLRHFIPMSMRTSACAVMNSREWSRYIGTLRGSDQVVEQILGDLLFALMTGTEELFQQGYVPESDVLIRHADANSDSFNTIQALKHLLVNESDIEWGKIPEITHLVTAQQTQIGLALADHVALLALNKSITDKAVFRGNKTFFEKAGEIIFNKHHHYNQVGPLFQMGALRINGTTDIGGMKDFNRQRSLERFIPFCENGVNVSVLLKNGYGLCEYLYIPDLSRLRKKYDECFRNIYALIRNLIKHNGDIYTTEQIRYLLPHAHQTPYNIYGSLDDELYTQLLRIRPGGHINYRMETWRWREAMNDPSMFGLGELWKSIPMTKPNPASREEFVNRG